MKKKPQKQKVEVKKLFKYSGEEGYRHLGALIEDMHDQFRAFGDNLSFVREKGEAVFEEVGKIKEDITEIQFKQNITNTRLTSLEILTKDTKNELSEFKDEMYKFKDETNANFTNIKDEMYKFKDETNANFTNIKDEMYKFQDETNANFTDIKKEIISIKNEVAELKQILYQKADLERIKDLEKRIFNIEKHLKLSIA